jgi:hypothetical protein
MFNLIPDQVLFDPDHVPFELDHVQLDPDHVQCDPDRRRHTVNLNGSVNREHACVARTPFLTEERCG